MSKVPRVIFSALTGFALVTALSVLPSNAGTPKQLNQQTQRVSWRISAFDKTSLTITVASANNSAQGAPSTMTFAIDRNTMVDGKMKVGSTADITYRQDNGTNVAVSIHVS
jgi:hypothetical protein